MPSERDRGILGFRLGPVRRAVYGFLRSEDEPSPEPAGTQEAQPIDELEKIANKAARRYREKIEDAVEEYKRQWTKAMRK